MIAYLKGHILDKKLNQLTLLTGGVGYHVHVSPRTATAYKLGQQDAQLHIYTHVREDTLSLFGFTDERSKNMFTLLLSVSGVGPKIALAVEAVAPPAQIERAIAEADVDFFSRIPGLGKKTAQRIIVDLKPKLTSLKELDLSQEAGSSFIQVQAALRSLGFSAQESSEAIGKVKNKSNLSPEVIVRQSLRNLKR